MCWKPVCRFLWRFTELSITFDFLRIVFYRRRRSNGEYHETKTEDDDFPSESPTSTERPPDVVPFTLDRSSTLPLKIEHCTLDRRSSCTDDASAKVASTDAPASRRSATLPVGTKPRPHPKPRARPKQQAPPPPVKWALCNRWMLLLVDIRSYFYYKPLSFQS